MKTERIPNKFVYDKNLHARKIVLKSDEMYLYIRLLLCNKSHWNHGYTCLVSNLVHRCPCENFEFRLPTLQTPAFIHTHTHIYAYICSLAR